MMARQKGVRSSGVREVITFLSFTTGSSTHSAPAFSTSSLTATKLVMRTPLATGAPAWSRAEQNIRYALEASERYMEHITTGLVEGTNVSDTIVEHSAKHDLVVMGTTEEPLFRNLLTGSIPARVAKSAEVTVIIVKRRSGVIRSVLRQTVLPPSTGAAANGLLPEEAEVLAEDSDSPHR